METIKIKVLNLIVEKSDVQSLNFFRNNIPHAQKFASIPTNICGLLTKCVVNAVGFLYINFRPKVVNYPTFSLLCLQFAVRMAR